MCGGSDWLLDAAAAELAGEFCLLMPLIWLLLLCAHVNSTVFHSAKPQCKCCVTSAFCTRIRWPFHWQPEQTVVPLVVGLSQNAALIWLKMIYNSFLCKEKMVSCAKTDYINVFWVQFGVICPLRRAREAFWAAVCCTTQQQVGWLRKAGGVHRAAACISPAVETWISGFL